MGQFDLFGNDINEMSKEIVYRLKDGHLIYYPNFFKKTKVNFETLRDSINWRQDEITIYGKTHPIPRLQSWYSADKEYSYSGIKLYRNDWDVNLGLIKDEIQSILAEDFNGCLCNLYRNGRDYAAWHSDDEDSLGRNPIIASASFGEARKFVLKHKHDKSCEKVEIELQDKSLLVMKGATQHYWKHQLNKTARKVGPRINLTFRRIIR